MRRCIRFRIRTLLFLVALASILPAIHINRAFRAQNQANIRRTLIESDCFHFKWDWQFAADFSPVDKPPYRRWIEERLGNDYLYSIAAFDLQENDDPEKALQTASTLGQIRRIKLLDCEVSLSCCKELQSFPKLQWLGLLLSPVDDDGMREIAKLKSLAILDIRNTQISDEAIDDLCSLPNLAWLNVHGSLISEQGVEELRARLPDCVVINCPKGYSVWPTIPKDAEEVAANQRRYQRIAKR